MPNDKSEPFTRVDTGIMRYFEYEHLAEPMLRVSKACAEVADAMQHHLPAGAEKSAGLRKLLEAKDCFVRASLDGILP